MDEKSYSKGTIEKYVNENLLFKDAKLKKYFDRNEQRDLWKLTADALPLPPPHPAAESVQYLRRRF